MMIIPNAEPFFFPGGKTGCLLIHGFTGAPKEMREMGEYLAQQRYTVLGIRLAGHATRPEDMIRTRWQDWLASVEDGWHTLRGAVDHIFLLGLSMGGALALTITAQGTHPVAGVVTMSTPFTMPARSPHTRFLAKLPEGMQIQVMKLMSKVFAYSPKVTEPPPEPLPEWMHDHIAYPRNPTRSGAELAQLLAAMRASLPKVAVPALVIHSRGDDYVPKNSMPEIYARIGSRDKEMLWLEKSGHVITRDVEKEQVFEAARAFIERTKRKHTS